MKNFLLKFVALMTSLLLSFGAIAYEASDADPKYWEKFFLERDLKEHSSLQFPSPEIYESNFNWQHKIFLPSGSGPHPLVVILPTCGGIDSSERTLLDYAIKRGYAAIVLDNHRGAKTNCMPNAQRPVKWGRMVKDLYDLSAHVSSLKEIDSKRLFTIGGSQGGMLGGLLASPGIHSFTAPNAPRYRASSSLYGCGFYPLGTFKTQVTHTAYFFNDTDRPLLWLMGSDDKECMVSDEIAMLEIFKKKGLPIQYHVYPGASHSWDHPNLNGKQKTFNYGGKTVHHTYRYDEAVTTDSYRKSFDFFDVQK